jgi:hypothetical protein
LRILFVFQKDIWTLLCTHIAGRREYKLIGMTKHLKKRKEEYSYKCLSSSRSFICFWHRRNLLNKTFIEISFRWVFTSGLEYFVWFQVYENSILMLLIQWMLMTFSHCIRNNHQKVLNTKMIKKEFLMKDEDFDLCYLFF